MINQQPHHLEDEFPPAVCQSRHVRNHGSDVQVEGGLIYVTASARQQVRTGRRLPGPVVLAVIALLLFRSIVTLLFVSPITLTVLVSAEGFVSVDNVASDKRPLL
jgi:hypothetical protein